MARGKSGLPINVLISALVVIALVPSAILFVQLWQDMMRPHSVTLPVTAPPTAEPPRSAGLDYPKDGSRFEVEDGDDTPSFADVDATDGAPGSAGGWSFASEETGALPSGVPAQSSSITMTPEPDAGDGPVLAQPTMQPSMAPSPAETEMADAADSNPFEETERTAQSEVAVPLPQRKPTASAGTAPTVRTVKVVTIAPPQPTRPHDGAYALGSPADEAPAEWMETKTAVDMHAKATAIVGDGEGRRRRHQGPRDGTGQGLGAGDRSKKRDHRLDLQSLPPAGRTARALARCRTHSGMLSCFFHGFSTRLLRSICSARATRLRVPRGRITSSI